MKAAVLVGPEKLMVESMDTPRAAAGEIVVKVRAAAICGTDVRMWKNALAGDPRRVLGHEFAGDIAEIGAGVMGYSVGDKVAVAPNMGCGVCDFCVAGLTHLCPDYQALGINTDGAFAEYVRIPENAVRQGNVCKLGSSIQYHEAAAVEPLSCAYNGFEAYKVHPGDSVLIIGAGPIGCMHAMLAKMAGAARITMNDLSLERLADCEKILPFIEIYCGDDLKGFIMEKTHGRGLDVCVTACSSPAAQAASLDLMGMFGRVCFFGGLPAGREMVPLNTNLIHYKHLLVTGTSRSSLSQYRKCLELVESGILPLSRIVTHQFALEEAQQALAFSAAAGGLKSVIEFR